MKLRAIYFDKIENGQKIYEVRLNDDKRKLLKIGDVIIFKKEPDLSKTLQAKVKDLMYFDSFKKMTETIPSAKIGFENSTKEEVESVYHTFYSADDERKYGVVAIKIQVE